MILLTDSLDSTREHPSKSLPGESAVLDADPPPKYQPDPPFPTGQFPKPANYVSVVHRLGSLEGSWVIDPSLSIPANLLPPLPHGTTEDSRRHLTLEARAGSIHAEVTLLDKVLSTGTSFARKLGKVTIFAKSHAAGNITLKLHAATYDARRRFNLTCHARSGSITLYIPRSFHGSMVLSVPLGFISVSRSISEVMATISQAHHTRRCFVGDISALDGSEYDELFAETKIGNLTVLYDDEDLCASGQDKHHNIAGGNVTTSLVQMSAGLFERIFGRWGPVIGGNAV